MAVSKFLNYCILIIVLLLISTCIDGAVKRNNAIFLFGDSMFDLGNNNYINTSIRANFVPYGQEFFNFPTGRNSDGRLIPDFIAEYSNMPLLQPYLKPRNNDITYGTSFASGGAGALPETFPGLVIDLKTQFANFKNAKTQIVQKLGDKEGNKVVSDALYLVSNGGNDYIYRYFTSSSPLSGIFVSDSEFVNMVMSNVISVIKGIHELGGRKFGIVNLGPLDCYPFAKEVIQENVCVKELTNLVKLHNEALIKSLPILEKELKGFKYSYFDLNTAVTQRMQNPSKYGFKDGEKACCGSGMFRGVNSCGGKRGISEYELCANASEYVFFDYGHASQPAYQQLAALFWAGTSKLTWPKNLKQLYSS